MASQRAQDGRCENGTERGETVEVSGFTHLCSPVWKASQIENLYENDLTISSLTGCSQSGWVLWTYPLCTWACVRAENRDHSKSAMVVLVVSGVISTDGNKINRIGSQHVDPSHAIPKSEEDDIGTTLRKRKVWDREVETK